jgi:hypothetical protein
MQFWGLFPVRESEADEKMASPALTLLRPVAARAATSCPATTVPLQIDLDGATKALQFDNNERTYE